MPCPNNLWSVSCACWLVVIGWMMGLACVGSELIIIRKVNMKDVYHKDRFNIPRAKCTDIRQGNKCAVYGGFERSSSNPCKCQCPPLKGTMVKYKNQWECTGNLVLRLREGCGFSFPYESSKSFIKMILQNQWQFLHAATSGCTLDTLSTSYLSCNGSWARSPRLARNIHVISRGFDQVARGYAYQVRVRKNSFTSGKMIKVSLTCRPFGGKPCLLFKTRGNQNCYFRRQRAYRKKFRKNKKATKVLSHSVSSQSSQSPSSMKGLVTLTNARGKPRRTGNRKKTDELRAEKLTRDKGVTTIILIFTASLLGAIILALTINLFFCSSNQETFKAKHIFRGRNDKWKSGVKSRSQSLSISSVQSSNFAANKLSLALCTNKVPRSVVSSNTELTSESTDEIQRFTRNSQACSQTSQEERHLEILTEGEMRHSLDSDASLWRKI